MITVDVVLAIDGGSSDKPIGKKITTPFVLLRSFTDVLRHTFDKDILSAKLAFPRVKFNVVAPTVPLPGDFLGFQYSKQMIGIGFTDATNSTSCRSKQ